MRRSWIESDRAIPKVCTMLENCMAQQKIEIKSIILFGARARGEVNSQTEYEIMVLVDDDINTNQYIKVINVIRIELLKSKLLTVKIQVYTQESFEDILYNDEQVGTLLYMIIRENIIIIDKQNSFLATKEKLSSNTNIAKKTEEEFLEQCIRFSKMMGSQKWEQKWEKTLMQYRYMKRRSGY